MIPTPCDFLCVYAFRWPAYRFDDVVSAIRQTSNVDFRLQFAVNRSEETLWAVDAHHSFLADLHTDAALQFIHRNLYVTHRKSQHSPLCINFIYWLALTINWVNMGNYWTTALSYHVPLSIIDGFPSTGDLERVLVSELDFNATTS